MRKTEQSRFCRIYFAGNRICHMHYDSIHYVCVKSVLYEYYAEIFCKSKDKS